MLDIRNHCPDCGYDNLHEPDHSYYGQSCPDCGWEIDLLDNADTKLMWKIGIEFRIESAHFLTRVPDTHKCRRLHGHNYVITVELASDELDDREFVADYFDLLPIKRFLDEEWDHRCLNIVVEFETTVERLAQFLYRKFKPQFPQLSRIRVSETPTTYCDYTED